MKKRTIKRVAGLALMVGGIFAVQGTQAAVVFDFNNDTDLDNVSLGSAVSTIDGLMLTTTEIIAWDGQLGSTNSSVKLNISDGALGVNSPSNPPNAAKDWRDFDPNEAWIFKFDQDVELNELNVASLDTVTELTMSSTAFSSDFVFVNGTSSDDFDLLNTVVLAGTTIMIQNTSLASTPETSVGAGDADSHDFRISELTVTVIPEPATLGLLGACAIGAFALRRFRG